MSYLTEFERILLNTDKGQWLEYIKKAFLNNKISNDLYKTIVALLLLKLY